MPGSVDEAAVAHTLGPIELVFVMLGVAVGLSYLSHRSRVAEPILLLVAGIGLSQSARSRIKRELDLEALRAGA